MSIGRARSSAHTVLSLYESLAMGTSSALKPHKLAGGKHVHIEALNKTFKNSSVFVYKQISDVILWDAPLP